MTLAQALQFEKQALVHTAHHAIVKAMRKAWRQKAPGSSRPLEREFVACLALFAAPDFSTAWQRILLRHGVHLTAASVFCHARPIVDTQDTKDPELGDILLVHRHQDSDGVIRRNALLFQAKVSSAQPHVVGKADGHQLRLYQTWPDFIYVTPRSLRGQTRVVQPKAWHQGALYLQLDERRPSDPLSGLRGWPHFPAGACLPQNPLTIHQDLAGELLSWLGGFSGRPFRDSASAASSNGWSRVVWDLLASALGKALNWKRRFYRGRPRYSGDVLRLLDGTFTIGTTGGLPGTVSEALGSDAEELAESAPPVREQVQDGPGDDDDGGISAIVIDTQDQELPR